jgi:hypothetical protein
MEENIFVVKKMPKVPMWPNPYKEWVILSKWHGQIWLVVLKEYFLNHDLHMNIKFIIIFMTQRDVTLYFYVNVYFLNNTINIKLNFLKNLHGVH